MHKDHIIKGVVHVCAAFFCFTFMQMLAKLVADQHNAIEVSFYRNAVIGIPFFLYIIVSRRFDLMKTKKPKLLAFRVIAGTIAFVLTIAAMQLLPMSNATVLFFLSTLLIPVFAHFFLKEHVGPHRWAAIIIGLIGVIIVAGPSASAFNAIGVAVALGAAFGHATIQVLLRGLRSENTLMVTFWFIFGGMIMIGVLMPWFYNPLTPYTMGMMVIMGLSGGAGQYFLTSAFSHAPASLLAPFNYTGLLWATGFDILIWGYVPPWTVFAGSAVIIGAKLYILHREKVKKAKREALSERASAK